MKFSQSTCESIFQSVPAFSHVPVGPILSQISYLKKLVENMNSQLFAIWLLFYSDVITDKKVTKWQTI